MRSKTGFIAMLFVGAICMFVQGAIEVMHYLEFNNNAKNTTAYLQGSNSKPEHTISPGGITRYQHTIKYQIDTGKQQYATPYFPKNPSEELMISGQVAITYLANRPNRIIFPGEEFPMGIKWFVIGVILTLVAIYAKKLLKRESPKSP